MTLAMWCSKCGAELPTSRQFADDLAEIVHLREIVELAKQVREAQKKYFKTRDRNDLVASKQIERKLDDMLT